MALTTGMPTEAAQVVEGVCRLPRVLVVAPRPLAHRLLRRLTPGFQADWVPDPSLARHTAPDVLIVAGPAVSRPLPALRAEVRVVFVVDRQSIESEATRHADTGIVLELGRDDVRLASVVRSLLVPPLLTEREIAVLRELPSPLRQGIELVLHEPLLALEEAVELLAHGGEPFPRKCGVVAARLGWTTDRLGRLARYHGVSWSRALRHAVLLRMGHRRLASGEPWERVFACFGFGTPSGGTDFVKRLCGGRPPSEVENESFDSWRRRLFGGALAAPPQGKR